MPQVHMLTDVQRIQSRAFGSKRSTVMVMLFHYRNKLIVKEQQPNFRECFLFIHYHLRKIFSQITERTIFTHFDFI